VTADTQRAQNLLSLATRATTRGLGSLDDQELLTLLAEHRWAIGRLAGDLPSLELRSLLNAAALRAHGALHRRPGAKRQRLGPAIARSLGSLGISVLVFVGSTVLALAVVLADPVLAYVIVPRQMLVDIDAHAWGNRGSTSADLGMTLFYWGNNLRASFMALGLGVLAGVPGLLVLAFNGMLLGAVAGTAVHRGALDRLLGWIAPHGVPELGALILCSALGLELGLSWIRPGQRLRRVALADAGRELLPLILVAGVLVICAAPLEGFVAPLELPPWLDAGIALGWVMVLAAGARYSLVRARVGESTSSGASA
jgi:uncharacterized membrane protein SpoIIM required for sporulation